MMQEIRFLILGKEWQAIYDMGKMSISKYKRKYIFEHLMLG